MYSPCTSHGRHLLRCQSGATIVLVAIMLPLLVALMAATVDISRLYVAQTKAQSALDNALLGAAATESGVSNIQTEARALFPVNFPTGYMGSTQQGLLTVTQASSGVYNGTVVIRVPTTILRTLVPQFTNMTITSQVTVGAASGAQIEMSVAIDNSVNMTGKQATVRTGVGNLASDIFNNTPANNAAISLVHYNITANVGPDHFDWGQGDFENFIWNFIYHLISGGLYANRNSDSPRNSFDDFTDLPPTVEARRFRLPIGANTFTAGIDLQGNPPPRLTFAATNFGGVNNGLSGLISAGDLRTNVGLMWAWFTLSPNWVGQWGAPTNRPLAFSAQLSKVLVLIVGGKNNVYLGVSGTSNDDTSTATLCSTIKGQGIKIITVAYANSASNVNETMLRNCASSINDYYFVSNTTDFNTAMTNIAIGQRGQTLRLTK